MDEWAALGRELLEHQPEGVEGYLACGTDDLVRLESGAALLTWTLDPSLSDQWGGGRWAGAPPGIPDLATLYLDGSAFNSSLSGGVRRSFAPGREEVDARVRRFLWGEEVRVPEPAAEVRVVEHPDGDAIYLLSEAHGAAGVERVSMKFRPAFGFAMEREEREVLARSGAGGAGEVLWWRFRSFGGFEEIGNAGTRIYAPSKVVAMSGPGPRRMGSASAVTLARVSFRQRERRQSAEELLNRFDVEVRRHAEAFLAQSARLAPDSSETWLMHSSRYPPLVFDTRFSPEAQKGAPVNNLSDGVSYRWGRPLPSDAEIQRAQFEGRPFLDPAEAPGASGRGEGAPAAVAPPARPAPSARLRTAAWVVGGLAVAAMVVMWLGRRRRRPA